MTPTYRERVESLLGDADPLQIQQELVSSLREQVLDLDPRTLTTPEGPDGWSVLDVVEHLVDAETVHAYRIRMVLEFDGPPLPGYDPNLWRSRERSGLDFLRDSLDLLELLRHRNLQLLRRLDATELARHGLHATRGRETIADMIRLTAGHDLIHRQQIDRILASTQPSGG